VRGARLPCICANKQTERAVASHTIRRLFRFIDNQLVQMGLSPIPKLYVVAKRLNAAIVRQIARDQSWAVAQSNSCYHWISTANWLSCPLQICIDPTSAFSR
jgi:hypothetical protein